MGSVSSLGEDFRWEGRGTWIGLGSSASAHTRVRSPLWIPKEWDLALHHRRSPLYLNQGYPLQLDEEIQLKVAGDLTGAVLPAACGSESPPLHWRIQWARVAHDKLVVRFQARFERGDLSSEETAAFQQQLRLLLKALAAEADLPR